MIYSFKHHNFLVLYIALGYTEVESGDSELRPCLFVWSIEAQDHLI